MGMFSMNTKILGQKVIHYQVIDSTQLEVWRRIEKGKIENGTVITADIQTAGKRYTWKSMAYR